MAKLKSVIKIEGTLNDLTFYKTKDGNLVKTKSGVNGNRIANDPAFARTRENGREFGTAARAGKLLRSAMRNMMANASDGRVTSRLTQLMRQILVLDSTSERGDRNVATAMATADAKAMLNGFDFNLNAALGTVLTQPYTVDITKGIISIAGLTPLKDLAIPGGATDVTFTGAWVKVDFGTDTYDVQLSNAVSLPLDNTAGAVTLTPVGPPAGAGTDVFALKVEFFQTVNGHTYSLNNGAFNCMCLVGVN
jgi:hypothetical protein